MTSVIVCIRESFFLVQSEFFQDKYKRKKKENQPANNPNSSSTDVGVIRIGHYILNETLGTGSFGKVKSISL